jgi:hypothetical protein
MAELDTGCCTPAAQATCCEPEDKAACCGDTHADGCGCARRGGRELGDGATDPRERP